MTIPSWLSAARTTTSAVSSFVAMPENIVKVGSTYWLLYSVATGTTTSLYLASSDSADGPWTSYGEVLTCGSLAWETAPHTNGGALVEHGGTFYLFYSCDDTDGAIGVATASTVTGPYTKNTDPLVEVGASGWDSLRVQEPSVWVTLDGTWVMAYMAEDAAYAKGTTEKIGMATATDPLGPWAKAPGNPLIGFGATGEWDQGGAADPSLFYENGVWWCLYSGLSSGGGKPWRLGLAYATDPEGPWTRHPSNPILGPGAAGAFDANSVWRGAIFEEGGVYHLPYGGIPSSADAADAKVGSAQIAGFDMTYSSEVLSDSPLLYLRFLETSGSSLADSSGNGRSFSAFGSPTLGVSGPVDKGITLDGADDYLIRAVGSWFPQGVTDPISLDFWVKNPSGTSGVVFAHDGYGEGMFAMVHSTLGVYLQVLQRGTWYTTSGAAVWATLTDGDWHHVGIAYDGGATSTSCRIHIDGVSQAISSTISSSGTRATTSALSIGRRDPTSPVWLAGSIAELAVYGAQLSAARMVAHHAAAAPGATGTVAGSLPPLTGSLAAATPRTGTVAGALPALTGSLVGTSGTTLGNIAGILPVLTGDLTGTVSATGAIAGVFPALTGSLTGDVGGAALDGVTLDVSVDLQVIDVESQTLVEQGVDVVNLSAGVGLEVVLQLTPDAPPLGALVEYPIRRNSHQMPALSAANPRYAPGDYTVVSEDYGRLHWFVDGVDVTYKRGVPMQGDYSTAVPFGSVSASLSAPQQRPWDVPGEGDWAEFDLSRDPELDVVIVKPDDSLDYKWEGYLARETDASGPGRMDYTYSAEGLFTQAASTIFDPPVIQNPIDPGWYIADLLNSVPHRRWTKIPRFTTGLPPVVDRGETGITVWQRVQNVLAKCIAADLRQLTIARVARRTYRIQWKQPVTVDQWTVTKGAPGVSMDLSRDQSTRYDAIYGRGVALDGGAWGNFYFPGLEFYTIPAYPMAGFVTMTAGTTDSDTTTGRGVTDWQKRMRFIGYPVSLDGVLNTSDLYWVRRIQKAAGILVDGVLGPQTWAATFNPGQYEENLKRVRLPLAAVDGAEPWLYSATGAVLGPNPLDEPWRIVRSIEVDFANMDKADAFPLAERMLDLLKDPAWVGTITLLTDPHEGSRFDIEPGDNVTPVGHRDEPNLQVAEVRADGLEVSLTVDSIGRDILAVEAILDRAEAARWNARRDPTGRIGKGTDMLSLNKSEVVEYESESKAGFFPRTAVNGNFGLWTVLPIFVSQIGVAKVEFTTSPKAEIVTALCSRPITANQIAALIPDPLSNDDGWYDNIEALQNKYGVFEVFGTPDQPGGYWPKQKTGSKAGPLTGVQKDTSSLLYNSAYGGFVWVAVFTSRSTYVEGRVYPATSR